MPLYEYQCKKCKHRFEKIQKFSDPLVKKCPECGGTVEQMLSAPAVQFKGSGWYVTDYASKKSTSESSSSEKAEKSDHSGDKDKDHSGDKDKKESKARKPETKKANET